MQDVHINWSESAEGYAADWRTRDRYMQVRLHTQRVLVGWVLYCTVLSGVQLLWGVTGAVGGGRRSRAAMDGLIDD